MKTAIPLRGIGIAAARDDVLAERVRARLRGRVPAGLSAELEEVPDSVARARTYRTTFVRGQNTTECTMVAYGHGGFSTTFPSEVCEAADEAFRAAFREAESP